MNAMSPSHSLRYRTVFISDAHLGTKSCRSDFLADFIEKIDCDKLFLVGDIIDGWRLRKNWYWDASHDRVVRALLRHVKRGTEIVYIPGNHDEMFRAWLPSAQDPHQLEVAGIEVRRETTHETALGVRLLILHGDEFDGVMRYAKFLARLGDSAYTAALVANRYFNAMRRVMGYEYWSLSQWLKRQVKGAVKAIDRFETTLAADAAKRGFDGIVCGHIHHAEMRMIGDVLYCNTGDWVESCTALVEQMDGRLELLDWAASNNLSFFRGKSAQIVNQPAPA